MPMFCGRWPRHICEAADPAELPAGRTAGASCRQDRRRACVHTLRWLGPGQHRIRTTNTSNASYAAVCVASSGHPELIDGCLAGSGFSLTHHPTAPRTDAGDRCRGFRVEIGVILLVVGRLHRRTVLLALPGEVYRSGRAGQGLSPLVDCVRFAKRGCRRLGRSGSWKGSQP